MTNVFARYRARYANRGDRYALIDSGHIGENLRLAAGELGLGEAAPARFEDDRLDALLGVDGREEAVCAVHLRRARAPSAASSDAALPGCPCTPRSARGARRAGSRAASCRARICSRSSRSRGATPRCTAARASICTSWCTASPTRPPACTATSPRPAGSRRSARGELAGALVRACLGQEKTGEAAAAIVGVARLAEGDGARSYRDLLLDAGATAQRIYLGAEALGLTARNLAAFYDDELDALLGLDGEREVAVHLTAVGAGD